MKKSLQSVFIFVISGLLLMSGAAFAQSVQTTAEKPPIAQPLVREGDFAIKLAGALKLGAAANEVEAENLLSSVGVEPRNGWIADYPVTPDIMGELQVAVNGAANAGKFAMGADASLKAMQEVIAGYNLSIKTDMPVPPEAGSATGSAYPDAPVINNYYYDEGPPVVTYYSPPPDYAYMYTWVPYPFWWWSFWYPGYYVLADFHVHAHGYGGRNVFISNHYRDTRTGVVTRIDPANRSGGGATLVRQGTGLNSSAARSGAQAIVRSSQVRAATGANRALRGYGERPSAGTRSSVFNRSRNSQFERAASDRGFMSRSGTTGGGLSNRGVLRSAPPTRGQSEDRSGGARRDEGGGGSRGGGGYQGGGRR